MKKLKNFWFVLVCIPFVMTSSTAYADTAIHLQNATDMVTGFTFDSSLEKGLIYCNPKGLQKQSMTFDANLSMEWISRYGSITFNQWGQDLPYAGMNEKGLCIIRIPEVSSVSISDFSISSLQWIQYHLDQYATIDEILKQPFIKPSFSHFEPMHYMLSDPSNTIIIVEFNDHETKIHSTLNNTLPWPVLTEIPYADGVVTMENPPSPSKESKTPTDRFVKMALQLSEWDRDSQNSLYLRAFDMLLNAASGETKWNVLFHLNERNVYFRTFSHDRIKIISLSAVDFSCEEPIRYWSVETQEVGNISDLFRNKSAKPDASWESIHLFSFNSMLENQFSLPDMQKITQFPYAYECSMDTVATDGDRLQSYALWWIAITAILAAFLFIVKGIKNYQKSTKNKQKIEGNQQPKKLYKNYKKSSKKKQKGKP
ncbi:MAG: linear amide C-N hydrolase [Caldisericia bacterium]|nr:linear amide C-N hydrolase [Caldisericia bacterium]